MAEIRGLKDLIILVRGGGEMATGVVHRLARSGFRICITEIPQPMAVRREVAFCEAVFDGKKEVEGLVAQRVDGVSEIPQIWAGGRIPIVIDPPCTLGLSMNPQVLVDAIIAKENTGTSIDDAPLVIGLGPGFEAGKDAHFVIETNRGHNLGRIIDRGEAEPNTGRPGEIGGYSQERVLRAPARGTFQGKKRIGERVEVGEAVAEVDGLPIHSQIAGVLRGLLRDGLMVKQGMKAGDVDPRGIREHCFTISEKARAIAGGVLEAILRRYNQ
jgi:xanthine dehydrogenase accessory factor